MIKNCPRCNGTPILDVRTLIARITCPDCGFIVIGNDKDEVINKWNATENNECGCESCKIG